MPSVSDFPAVGKVIAFDHNTVTFVPANMNYEWKLATATRYDGPLNTRIECVIRARARKVYSVSSGGNFVQPIFGPPRIVQGRIKHLEERLMVVQAGAPIVVELPEDEHAFDMENGFLAVGALVNAVCLPEASFVLLARAKAK